MSMHKHELGSKVSAFQSNRTPNPTKSTDSAKEATVYKSHLYAIDRKF